MQNETVAVGTGHDVARSSDTGTSVELSRSAAVERVFGGVATAVVGYAVSLGAGPLGVTFGVPPLLTVGASAALLGVGLFWAGRGAEHLLRYGNRSSAVALVSAAGLGGSILATVGTRALLEFTAHPVLSGLNQIAMAVSGLFTAALLIQIVVILVRWTLPGAGAETDELQ